MLLFRIVCLLELALVFADAIGYFVNCRIILALFVILCEAGVKVHPCFIGLRYIVPLGTVTCELPCHKNIGVSQA